MPSLDIISGFVELMQPENKIMKPNHDIETFSIFVSTVRPIRCFVYRFVFLCCSCKFIYPHFRPRFSPYMSFATNYLSEHLSFAAYRLRGLGTQEFLTCKHFCYKPGTEYICLHFLQSHRKVDESYKTDRTVY